MGSGQTGLLHDHLNRCRSSRGNVRSAKTRRQMKKGLLICGTILLASAFALAQANGSAQSSTSQSQPGATSTNQRQNQDATGAAGSTTGNTPSSGLAGAPATSEQSAPM